MRPMFMADFVASEGFTIFPMLRVLASCKFGRVVPDPAAGSRVNESLERLACKDPVSHALHLGHAISNSMAERFIFSLRDECT